MTLKAKLDLWSPNKHFLLIPWPQKPIKNGIICYSEILHFSNMAAGGHLEFWKMLNDDSVLSLGILIYTYKRIRKCNKTLYGLSSEVGQKIKRLPTDYNAWVNGLKNWCGTLEQGCHKMSSQIQKFLKLVILWFFFCKSWCLKP